MQTHVIGDDPQVLLQHPGYLVSIDTETTGVDWDSRLIGVALAWRHLNSQSRSIKSCYLSVADYGQMGLFMSDTPVIDAAEYLQVICKQHIVVGHNWPFDYRMLMHWLGVEPVLHSFDTMHLAKCTGWFPSLGLVNVFEQAVGKTDPWMKAMKAKRKILSSLEPETQAKYAAGAEGDAGLTLRLAETLLPVYKEISGKELWRADQNFSHLVMQMVQQGVPLDLEWCQRKRKQFAMQMTQIQLAFADKGVPNLGSTKMIRKYLYSDLGLTPLEHTPGGKPRVNKDAIVTLAKQHPEISGLADIIKFNEYQKAIGSWIDPLLNMGAWDGKAHGQLSPFGTRTFRMSSAAINMQGIPLKDRGRAYGGFGGVFKDPDPDFQLWQLDLAQAEVRMAAIVAAENNLAAALASEGDPYVATSQQTWGTPDRRQDAKSATLSSIYATGKKAFAEHNNITLEQAGEILSTFRGRFPNIGEATSYWEDKVWVDGYVPGPLFDKKRRIYLDTAANDLYKAYNNIVQCSVAQVMQKSMLQVAKELPGALLLQIHDSIVLRLHIDQVAKGALELAGEIISEVLPSWLRERTDPQIPILVDTERFDLEK